MTNTVYIFDKMIRDDYEVRDFTNYYYGNISNFFRQYSELFEPYTLEDDEKMENVSYKLYGTTDYADLIVAVNQDVLLWNVPYNQDINKDRIDILFKLISNSIDSIGSEERKNKKAYILAEELIEEQDNLKRNIIVPKKDQISTVVGLIERYRDNYNLNSEISEAEARSRIGLF